jgi:hypothetical protein
VSPPGSATAASTSAKAAGIGPRDVCRQARLVDPLVEHQPPLERRVAAHQVGAHVGKQAGRGHRLKGVAIEIGAQPGVEPLAADDLLDGAQEDRALVIDDAGDPALGVPSAAARCSRVLGELIPPG